MASRRKNEPELPKPRRPPAVTPDERENQLIAAAVDLAEEQILAGTASAQVISHFLKLGSSRERLEQARISGEVRLVDAKVESIASGKRIEALYEEAITAIRAYQGQDDQNL